MQPDLLSQYHKKRDFGITAEPRGKAGKKAAKQLRFVIQLHEATRTHYDFRLEWDGVMKSWAVTKGPSFDPEDKRLAVRTEDHPIDYNEFEGVIPDKQYGAGPVMIWDEGVWQPDNDPRKMEKKGHISFTIEGERMKGHWHLVRMHTKEKRENWLLIKGDDEYVLAKKDNASFLGKERTSVVSGRTMEEIREAGLGKTVKRVTKKAAAAKPQKKAAGKKSRLTLSGLMKKYPKPELATLVKEPPPGEGWIHEIKYDGYRLMAFIANGEVVLRTRGDKDWTHKFGALAKAFAALKVESAVLDLEACVVDDKGRTDFSALQEALSEGKSEKIEGWIFDLLYLNGEDFSKRNLLERKEALAALLKKAKSPLHYSDHFESSPDLLGHACKIGAEGLVSKRKDSTYAGRRGNDWLKSKCGLEQEFVIGGFMPAKDSDKAVGALLLGYYKGKKFQYAGKIGTGFTRKTAQDVYRKLVPLKSGTSPFPEKIPRGRRGYIYLEPEMMCEVSFMEWTPEGHIRHGSFKGLREDKSPKTVKEEIPVSVKEAAGTTRKKAPKPKADDVSYLGVTISHPDREVYPGTGITKGDVAQYYDMVAPIMLPFVKKRLISLLRCTDGIKGQCFFQRNPMAGMGDHIHDKPLTHNGNKHDYLYVQDETGLMQLVQMGTMEFHAWQSLVGDTDKATQIIFDLDPDEGVPFEAVKLAAQDIRARLKKLKLESFARLSGGKGVHVVVPIKPKYEWDDVKEFARGFAEQMAADTPEAYVANMSKKKRTGKIFIDFFRNDFSATAIVPFSLRAREGAPVAWPLSWTDLKKAETAHDVHIGDVTPAKLKKAQKVCEEFLKTSQSLKI